MKTIEYTEQTGKIKTFLLQNEIETIIKVPRSKPSSRILYTKKGKKALAALIDLERYHNHSWYKELLIRAQKNPNALALFYRGNKITFYEMFKRADLVAQAMVNSGIKYGDEIPCCLSNTPELVYILLAANKIGAKVNLFGSSFDKDYLSTILDSCSKNIFFCTDDNYSEIRETVLNAGLDKLVVISLADSIPENPKECDEFEPSLESYYHYDNKLSLYKDDGILSFDELLSLPKENIEVIDAGTLDTEFLVTYTSGSTKIGHPKQITHTNRSLITSGRFHDSELSVNLELNGLRGLAHIHSESNTNVITCISDNLMQLWSVALEPEYDKKKVLEYVMLNKPNYLNAPTSFLIEMAKEYLFEKKFHEDGKGRKLPFLLAAFAVGEGTSKGEEKLINRFLRESRAGSGVKILGFSMPFTTLSVGGGDCEHGGIYYTLWRSMQEKVNFLRLKKHELGLLPEPFAQVSAFKKNNSGEYEECDYNECGLIAANSATTMRGYKGQQEETSKLLFRDNLGRDWVSSNVYGYIDELGAVHIKDRIGNEILTPTGEIIMPYMIQDEVCRDTKNVLSCTVTCIDGYFVINVEFQPDKKKSDIEIIKSIISRISSSGKSNLINNIVFRIIDYKNSFPLTASGKRSIAILESYGLDNVVVYDETSNTLKQLNKNHEKGKTLKNKPLK